MEAKLYEKQKHTLYYLNKSLGLSKDCLNKYARGERKIEKLPAQVIIGLAYQEKVEANKLFEMMKDYQKKKLGE